MRVNTYGIIESTKPDNYADMALNRLNRHGVRFIRRPV
jgi:hypothetical protein